MRRVDSNQPPSLKSARSTVAASAARSALPCWFYQKTLVRSFFFVPSLFLYFVNDDDDVVDDVDVDDFVGGRLDFSSLLTSAGFESADLFVIVVVSQNSLSTQFHFFNKVKNFEEKKRRICFNRMDVGVEKNGFCEKVTSEHCSSEFCGPNIGERRGVPGSSLTDDSGQSCQIPGLEFTTRKLIHHLCSTKF